MYDELLSIPTAIDPYGDANTHGGQWVYSTEENRRGWRSVDRWTWHNQEGPAFFPAFIERGLDDGYPQWYSENMTELGLVSFLSAYINIKAGITLHPLSANKEN